MRKLVLLSAVSILIGLPIGRSVAVELLVSGDFEPPTNDFGQVPGWNLQEYLTGSSAEANTAQLVGTTDIRLQLNAFAAGGPLTPNQGNFNSDGLPAGNVDGQDFLIWQRGYGDTGTKLPSEGDATDDMNVNGADLSIWQSNYGAQRAGVFSNAILSQTVPAAAGETYSFEGTSEFEDNYSGFVTICMLKAPTAPSLPPLLLSSRWSFLIQEGGHWLGNATRLTY